MQFPPHQRIADAIHTAQSESEIVDSERTAYRLFVRQLDKIDTANGGAEPGARKLRAGAVEEASIDESLRAAREAYRETVMATPHYREEYSESLREHATAEFGSTIATQFVDGKAMTPLLRRALRDGATEAIRQRAELLKSLGSELRSLQGCRDDIDDIQERLNRVHARLAEKPDPATQCAIDDRLASLEAECETLLTRRQRQINNRSGISLTTDTTHFGEYLYDDLDSCFPVLTGVTKCVDTIRTCRMRSLR